MSEGTTCHKRVKCTQGGRTAHIVPVPRLMGLKDFPLNYCSFLERYKLWRFDRIIWQGQNYRQQALCLRINPHFRARQNCERHKIYGAWEKRLHINEQTSRTAVVVVTFDNFFSSVSRSVSVFLASGVDEDFQLMMAMMAMMMMMTIS